MTTKTQTQIGVQRARRRSGQSLVIGALFVVALFGFAALSFDVGKLYIEKKKLQNATDAAALAGALQLPQKDSSDNSYETTAQAFVTTNRVTDAEIRLIQIGDYDAATKTFTANAAPKDAVLVSAQRTVPMSIAPVIGIKTLTVSAHSVAQAFATDSVTGQALPWVIEFDTNAPPSRCQPLTLRFDVSPTGGAWAPLGDPMSGDTYRNRIWNDKTNDGGYEGTLSVGDTIQLVTGVKTGPNQQGVSARIATDPNSTCGTVQNGSERIVIVPFIPPGTMAAGAGGTVKVGGFAAFFLTGVSDDGKVVYGEFHDIFAGKTVLRRTPSLVTPNTVILVE
jgi:Flp pilus assembly protein TadG